MISLSEQLQLATLDWSYRARGPDRLFWSSGRGTIFDSTLCRMGAGDSQGIFTCILMSGKPLLFVYDWARHIVVIMERPPKLHWHPIWQLWSTNSAEADLHTPSSTPDFISKYFDLWWLPSGLDSSRVGSNIFGGVTSPEQYFTTKIHAFCTSEIRDRDIVLFWT